MLTRVAPRTKYVLRTGADESLMLQLYRRSVDLLH
jgi:hypothetical protein